MTNAFNLVSRQAVLEHAWTLGCVTRILVRAKSGPSGPLFAAKIGPAPDHFWLPNLVRVTKSGPGFITLHETSPCPVKLVYIVTYDPRK